MAAKRPKTGDTVSGVLVKRGFNYHIVSPEELQHYTELSQGVVTQRQVHESREGAETGMGRGARAMVHVKTA